MRSIRPANSAQLVVFESIRLCDVDSKRMRIIEDARCGLINLRGVVTLVTTNSRFLSMGYCQAGLA